MAKNCFVTLGKQRYRIQRPWPENDFNPEGISDVAVMADGRVVALMRGTPQLIVFSPDGEVDEKWVVPDLVSGHYLSARPQGGLLVVDWDGHQVLAVDHEGKTRWHMGEPEKPQWMAAFSHPTSAAETADGEIYVSDGYGNFCLHRFDQERKRCFTIGQAGTGNGEFSTPHCVVVSAEKEVFVADRENNRIQVFDAAGVWLRSLGFSYKPMALALTHDNLLLVTDQTPSLLLMSKTGKLLGRCRTSGMYGHGLACAPDGSIYIAEMLPSSLVKMTPVD